MTSRERVLKALHHETPDRVPIDLGGTVNSSIVKEGYDTLRQYLGFSPSCTSFIDTMMRSVKVDDDVEACFDTDFEGVFPRRSLPVKWLDDRTYRDQWGITWAKKEGIFYFEQVNYPLAGDVTIRGILDYPWPNPDDIDNEDLEARVRKLRRETEKALILALPSPMIHTSQYLRGFEDWYVDCAANVKLIETLFDILLEINMRTGENILQKAAKDVEIIKIADDLGTQSGLQVSPDFFRKTIKPRLKKYTDLIRTYAPKTSIHMHSCGSIECILEDLIEIGIDVIHPVQVSARDMNPELLKKKYGHELGFWGGIDTQSILPKGKPEEVEKEVEHIVSTLGKNGGYVLGAVHNIQPDVPPENIVAMYGHGKKYSTEFYRG
jgi:uroporphyrinogen decarboxylase